MNRTYNILLLGCYIVEIKNKFNVIDTSKFLLWNRKCPIGINRKMIFYDYTNHKSLITAL